MGCLKLDILEQIEPTLKVVHGDRKVAQRWLSTDPLAADYPGWSPYNYVMGNPISLIDPDGRAPGRYVDESTGEVLGDDGVDDGLVHTIKKEDYDRISDESFIMSPEGKKSAFSGAVSGTEVDTEVTSSDIDPNGAPLESIESVSFQPIEIDADAKMVQYAAIAGTMALADGPAPVGDVAGAVFITIGAVVIGGVVIYNEFAHKRKKQSSGSKKRTEDRHAKQYRHGGKKRPKNPNQRKKAQEHKNKGR